MRQVVNYFRVSTTPPVKPLTTAVAESHKLPFHGESTTGTDVVGGLAPAVREHFQLSHRHRYAEACQGKDHPPQQERRIPRPDQIPSHR